MKGVIKCGPRCILELDDFHSQRHDVLKWLLTQRPWIRITLFTLLGPSDFHELRRISEFHWVELGLHGWDHFSEWRWGYWEMRHYLEMVRDLGFFVPIFKMPWNHWIRLGAIKILREYNIAVSSPKKTQQMIYRILGLKVHAPSFETVWLHPCDLTQISLRIDPDTSFYFVSESLLLGRRRFSWD